MTATATESKKLKTGPISNAEKTALAEGKSAGKTLDQVADELNRSATVLDKYWGGKPAKAAKSNAAKSAKSAKTPKASATAPKSTSATKTKGKPGPKPKVKLAEAPPVEESSQSSQSSDSASSNPASNNGTHAASRNGNGATSRVRLAPGSILHQLHVRPGVVTEILLPQDLTEGEANRLSSLIRHLSFGQ